MAMLPKPTCHSGEYATQFQDASVVAAYVHRPPYPAAVFDLLEELVSGQPRAVLDIGCGTGDIARPLVERVARLDALDVSEPMIAAGKAQRGGDHPQLRWIVGCFEDIPLDPPYGLVTAGQSLHWTDWDIALPRIGSVLAAGAYLAIIERELLPAPWDAGVLELIQRYSTNVDFVPYNLIDELVQRDLFAVSGDRRTAPVPFQQSVEAYIESFHSMNGLSRERMSADAATAFDGGVRDLLGRHGCHGSVSTHVMGRVIWGRPHRTI
jgi:SAM-dependent methyltransferase